MDGRVARRERNQNAVLDVVLEMFAEDMMQPGPDGPIYMVNLLKFKEHADYDDGRETDLSGRDAYQIYGREVSKLIREYGDQVTFAAGLAGQLNIETVSSPFEQ